MNSNEVKKPSSFSALKKNSFSKNQMLVFVVLFGIIGGYILYHSFAAAPVVASLEAEQMILPPGGTAMTDRTASAGKAVKLTTNGTAAGSVNFPSSVTSLTILAKGAQCSGAPAMTVSLDGNNLLTGTSVSSTAWTRYSVNTDAAAGPHKLSVAFTNDYSSYSYGGWSTRGHHGSMTCSRDLYLDVTNFYGPAVITTPAPTVSLSVSPSSVTAGTAATITWNSTNASTCNASGAWSGSQPTSGSTSTGALNQNSTYTLSCNGTGGTSSASATVSVAAAPPPPVGGGGTVSCTKTLAATDDILTAYNAAHAGDVICLHTGTVYNVGQIDFRNAIGSTNGAITITSQDRAHPSTILGRIVTHPPANYITLSYLILDGKHSSGASDITIGSDYVSLIHNDITDENTGICINTINDADSYGTAHYTLIDQNRIHNCGELPSTNQDHGIYDVGYYSTITNNYIYDNVDRGIQLRQDHNATVKYNTVNNNGEGILLGDSSTAAVNDEIAFNISANSNIRSNIEEFWSPGPPSNPNNRIHDNCVWASNADSYYNGNGGVATSFSGATVSNTKVANPNFTNAGAKDFTLQSGSGCVGYGVQPGLKPGIN